ncbi:MAG: type IV pilus secretin PilQ [Thermodesulfovibrionales bacterium]|nr:type IV pilus secretin PilQ [Thermodesulfovibrionales bacterium]
MTVRGILRLKDTGSLTFKFFFFSFALLILASGCATTTGVQEERQIATLTAIDITDNTLNINADKPFTYTIYKPSDPYKAIVELPDMRLGIAAGKIKSDKAGITEIMPSQTEEPLLTTLEILLSSPAGIVPAYKGTLLTLNIINLEEELKAKTNEKASETPSALGGAEEKTQEVKVPLEKAAEPPKEVKAAEVTKPEEKPKTAEKEEPKPSAPKELPPATSIVKVNIEKEQDVLKLIIKGNGSLNPNVFELDNRTVLDIPNVTLETPLPKAQSPLKGIRSGKYKDKIRIVFDMKEKTNFTVTAIEDSVIVSFQLPEKEKYAATAEKPASMETKTETAIPAKPAEEGKYKGQKISLDFQDADIGPLFRLLADISGYNFVIDSDVKGKITLKLMNVPWEQALDIILQTHGLAKQEEGNIMWIAPIAKFTKMSKEKTEAKDIEEKATAALSPLERKTYRLMFANAQNVKQQLLGEKLTITLDPVTKERTVTTGYDEKQRVLSPRGQVTSDIKTNVIIVSDIPAKIAQVDDLIKEFDQATRQVMIEAKIVEVGSDYSESMGIRWGGTIGTPPAGIGIGEIKSGTFAVNTPLAGVTGPGGVLGLSLGSASTVQVNLSLSALESVGKSRTLSNPKILTLDNKEANIEQGTAIPYTIQTDKGPQTDFKMATLGLTVTPTITPEGNVQIHVKATNNTPGATTPTADIAINTMSLTTNALVKNGETLVLGGIYKTSTTESETGIPLLSRIPILGWLFKTKTQTGPNVKELLILITPTIVTKP